MFSAFETGPRRDITRNVSEMLALGPKDDELGVVADGLPIGNAFCDATPALGTSGRTAVKSFAGLVGGVRLLPIWIAGRKQN